MQSSTLTAHSTVERPVLYLATSKDGGAIFDPERDYLFKLTPIAAQIWKMLISGSPPTAVAAEIARLYQIDQQRVDADLKALLRDAAKVGITPAVVVMTDQERIDELQHQSHFYSQQSSEARVHPPTHLMIFCALAGLALFDIVLSVFSLQSMCRAVKSYPVKQRNHTDRIKVMGEVCAGVERACIWYPHKAVCLQRSAVTTCMLRAWGIPANLVIAVRPMPFLAHAWVEVDGTVVNDRPQVKKFYQRLTVY
jgi:hypothetical protein